MLNVDSKEIIRSRKISFILWAVAMLLLGLWLLGVMNHYLLSGYIHLLFVIAISVGVISILKGKGQI